MIPDSEANELYEKMCRAREAWELASESFQNAVRVAQNLEGNSEELSSLKAAATCEVEALKTYRTAVEAYAKAVKNNRHP